MTLRAKGRTVRHHGPNSTLLNSSRLTNPYSLANRPHKILDALHEVVSRTTDIWISFFPLLDTMHLLVPKPIALSFFCATGRSRRKRVHVYTTFPEDQPVDDFLSRFGTDGFAKLAGTMIEIPRPAGSQSEKFYLLISAIRRNASAMEPYHDAPSSSPPESDELPPSGSQAEDIWLFKRLFDELSADANQPLSKRALEVLNRNLSQRRQSLRGSKKQKGPTPIKRARAELEREDTGSEHRSDVLDKWPRSHREFAEFIRPMLDEALSDIWDVEPLRAAKNTPFPNLFCVFRYALPEGQQRGGFTYDARILLSRYQCQQIDEWLDRDPIFTSYKTPPGMNRRTKLRLFHGHFKSNANNVRSALEEPVSRNFRSISDTVFQSGLIDFSDEVSFGAQRSSRHSMIHPDRTSAGDRKTGVDRERKRAEALILGQHGLNLFYVPLHIGGVPWISLFSMNNDSGRIDAEVWRSQYHLYRGLIPTIAANFRRLGQHYYRKALASVMDDVLASNKSGDVFETLNRRWARLTTYFPYPLVRALPTHEARPDFFMPDGGRPAVLTFPPNPNSCFVEGQLVFDKLDELLLKESLQTVATKAILADATRLKALELGSERERIDVAHSSKNMMNSITSLIRGAKTDLLDSGMKQEHLWNAEQYSLFIGQDYGVLQYMMEFGKSAGPVLERLSEPHLLKLAERCVRYITAVNQLIYGGRRQYFVNGESVTGTPPSDILYVLKARIQTIYRDWDLDYTSAEWEFRTDPLFCIMFFIFREIVDNMRPRPDDDAQTGNDPPERYIDIRATQATTNAKTRRAIMFRQRAPRDPNSVGRSPFLGADRAASVARFNRRYGPESALRLAEIQANPPQETDDWYIFELIVVFFGH